MKIHGEGLTNESAFPKRLWAFLCERFPLPSQGLLIVSYYSSNQFLAHSLDRPGEAMRYTVWSLAGAVTLLCLFFHLRVLDEHKDYDDDCRHYPHRVLQRGLVTLRDLRILGWCAVLVGFVLSFLRGPGALVSYGVTIAFSLLMLKEFFVRDWLRRHFLVYATSHMLIMPLFALVVWSFATGKHLWEAPGWFWLYAFVGFFVAFNWEISRKIRAPEQEIEGVDSYTKIFGTYGAAWAVLAVRVIDTGMVALVGRHLGVSIWFYGVIVALFVLCMVGFLQYRFRTGAKTAKRMEVYAGMYIVAFDLTLAVELARMHGLGFAP